MKKTAILLLMLPALALAQAPNDAGITPAGTFNGVTPRDVNGTVTFDGTEPTMSPRFFRSGIPGDPCALFGTGAFQFQEVEFTSDAGGQLTVDFDPGTCATNIFVTFHTPPFNPASICTGYLWSEGSSIAFNQTFTVPANAPTVMVVSGVANAPTVVCGPATYAIQGGDIGGVAEADLSVTIVDNPDPVEAGSQLGYVITSTNNGPDPADDVSIALPLPAGTTLASAVASGSGSCAAGDPVICTWLGATAAGASNVATIIVNVDSSLIGTTLTAVATTTSTTADSNGANNTATATTAVIAGVPPLQLPVMDRFGLLLLALLICLGAWRFTRRTAA